jgi:hypothetical protein
MTLAGCAADGASSEAPAGAEEDLSAGAGKVLAKDLPYPGDLTLADGKLYWTQSVQVASGDPELDQEFAYWTGSIWSFNVTHSTNPKKLAEPPSLVKKMTTIGNTIWITQPGFVSKTTAADLDAKKEWKSVYQDVDHFQIDEQEEVASSAIANGRVYVLRTTGEIVSVKTDGSDFKSHLKSSSYASNLFVSGDYALWVTASENQPYERAVFQANITAAHPTAKQIAVIHESATPFVQDGDSVYFGTQSKPNEAGGAILKMKLGSNAAPEAVVKGLSSTSAVVFDGDQVLFTGKLGTVEGLFSVPKSNMSATPKAVYKIKAAADILPTPDAIYLTSTALDATNHYDGKVVQIAR